ncbi:MAG: nuclear transport factor 2 family protein [Dehalococcoidia bacterium]
MATAVQSEILQLEKRYWDAIKSGRYLRHGGAHRRPVPRGRPQGATLMDRKQFREIWSTDDWRVRSFTIDDRNASVRPIGNDVAVVAYRVNEELEQQGKPQQIEAYDTSVWVRENGSWRCAAHTETPAMPGA